VLVVKWHGALLPFDPRPVASQGWQKQADHDLNSAEGAFSGEERPDLIRTKATSTQPSSWLHVLFRHTAPEVHVISSSGFEFQQA
jgi:hypothetical protein